jgi:beta-mannanase
MQTKDAPKQKTKTTTTTKIGTMAIFATAAMLLILGSVTNAKSASAATSLMCVDTNTSNDITDESPVQLNTPVHCDTSTTNVKVTSHKLQVVDGTGAVILDTGIVSGKTASADFTTNNQGVWQVVVQYYDATGARIGREVVNISISFFVLPESPIGVAALMGSSLAVLGAFVGLRRYKASAAPITAI